MQKNSVTIWADSSRIDFVFYAADIVRVDFLPEPGSVIDTSYVVIRDTSESVPFAVSETDSFLQLSTSLLVIRCTKTPLRMTYYNSSMDVLLSEGLSGGFATAGVKRLVAFRLDSRDHFYGTGERGTDLDKRGQKFGTYNDTFFDYISPLPRMNINIPLMVNPNGYALYFENTYDGQFNLGATDPAMFSYEASGGELSVFVIVGETVQRQLERYTWLTGRQPLPPRWAFGYIQSKFGYQNEAEAEAVVQTMRQEQIPCDAIVLDLYWYQNMGDLSWNSGPWPSPFQMMSDFMNVGIKTIVITEPYVTSRSANFSEGSSQGFLAKDSTGQTYRLDNWWSCNCDAGLVDLTNPAAQTWWWSKHPAFMGQESGGVAGLWTDLGEPERHPSDMQHFTGPAPQVHNIYNLLWAKTIFDGFDRLRPDRRLFNLTRSGYAGIQRYGVIPWSADVGNDFGGLAVQLPMMLNMGMSGLAYHNSDIGGFCCGATPAELYVRWMQYGTFCPIARAHGTGRATEPWGYGPQGETIARDFIRLRYQLLPYIYTMAYANYISGLPLARPLFFSNHSDPSLSDLSSEYMWGDDLLVAPVVQSGQTSSNVLLPAEDTWFDYWTGRHYEGGQNISISTPLETLPLFARAGSIIPMQPVMNYSDERTLDTLLLAVYPWPGSKGTFSLYEDDGKTLAYQSGGFALTELEDEVTGTEENTSLAISIGSSIGTYADKPQHRVFLIIAHGIASRPAIVSKNLQPIPERSSYTVLREAGDGFYIDSIQHQLFVQIQTVPDSSYIVIAGSVHFTNIPFGRLPEPEYRLDQNYPNPFNPMTTIRYQLAERARVRLAVYDPLGRLVMTLVDRLEETGIHSVRFDASGLASGVYFCRLQAGEYQATRKLVLIR